MDKYELERIEAILIMVNKILYVVANNNAGYVSPEVAMAEITDIVIGKK